MPRPRKALRPVEKNISLPEDIVARVDLELFSELEGKVPFGAWQRFVGGLIQAHFERQTRASALATTLREYNAALFEDKENMHVVASKALCDELEALGYGEAVEVFRKLPKWYA